VVNKEVHKRKDWGWAYYKGHPTNLHPTELGGGINRRKTFQGASLNA